MSGFTHIPVMRDEAMMLLAPRAGGRYLDGTFGGGGYTESILSAAPCTVWAIDRDPAAIARGAALAQRFPDRLHLIEGRFGDALSLLDAAGVASLDGAVFDFGVSSYQIDDPARGFSFRTDGPLDMRMGSEGPTAADIVNHASAETLADILYQFGEERASRRIAAAIAARRVVQKFETTFDLARVIRSVVRPDKSGIDPATRSFQALRIEVNQELAEIEKGLAAAVKLLVSGGRLVVVSFHSLEDRIAKQFMAHAAGRTAQPSRHEPVSDHGRGKAQFRLLTKGVMTPSEAETRANPRARSARLRAIERVAA
ncbi:MAG TPA: 16S rRNA (cytosine(1402)-N(4))-methyltransferase RsmH [Acidiphilium sp.]|nr:MAG: 16S rRNA (cytosine(1402)-N(4))-methyltransferase [Acidiphilium sp. 21-60-14]OYV91501.1 MAG: 16S rRNA (cytosine(1402)-N(4))-methyltransferase [Acidiphilium sp. 37-60-79]OZB39705.1 MAG: 16S rRNA (cytosine(1402)-N(4))-methyltransferase [Acidiphilium sp. 34-60-192]HQT87186.1 16S rRNA (cytosine(1402)-N(4))-methyltransferase RsmH [Acidiphilium sp.]HQU23522.1 16S rRNA (cytosine(1402)-N(4))-methyltransferase RsmH [Acidiphilium sp.]